MMSYILLNTPILNLDHEMDTIQISNEIERILVRLLYYLNRSNV